MLSFQILFNRNRTTLAATRGVLYVLNTPKCIFRPKFPGPRCAREPQTSRWIYWAASRHRERDEREGKKGR